MTDIQRWEAMMDVGVNEPYKVWIEAMDTGRYVLYTDHVEALDAAVENTRSRAYTLMGAAIQNGIDAERKRIHFAINDLVNGDVLDISLREHRAVLEAIYENGGSDD